MKTDWFSGYHPFVNFIYFVMVLFFSMVFMNPICLALSFFSAVLYMLELKGGTGVKKFLIIMLPMLLITALVNPIFNHEGATIITYFPNGNPLTLESIIYGIGAMVMLCTVIGWFSCINEVFTSDKFMYIFGRIIPSLSLVLSMVLRFVPRFKAQFKTVSNAQLCVGRDISSGGIVKRLKGGIVILSIMITWSLENAVETADSMKSRGYGLKGRTAYSLYRFDSRDMCALLSILILCTVILTGSCFGGYYFRYFPYIKIAGASVLNTVLFAVYGIFCLIPVIINKKEAYRWKLTQSKT